MIEEIDHPLYGKLRMLSNPVKLRDIEHIKTEPPPMLGQHTEEILQGLGYTREEITKLEEEGIIGILKENALAAKAFMDIPDKAPTRRRADKKSE
jgi:hypothetical protein